MQKILFISLFICLLTITSFSQNPQRFFLNDWQPRKINSPVDYITVSQTDKSEGVTIKVNFSDTITKVSKYVFGNNANPYSGKMNKDSAIVRYLRDLKPNVIRWPGGNLSNVYFWNHGPNTFPDDIPAGLGPWSGKDNGWSQSNDDYYELLKKSGSTGIICVNISYARYGTGPTPVPTAAHYAADWVRYDKGRTKFWELGNENFGSWQAGYKIDTKLNKDGQPEYISGNLYGKISSVFIDSMRAAAKEIGSTIYIGAVAMDSKVTYDKIMENWNKELFPLIKDKADFLIVHSYYTPYDENSTINTILNSSSHTNSYKDYVTDGMKTAGGVPLPVALTEWNIFAVGSKQAVSYINGMHSTLVAGELIKNKYGLANKWDLANGWGNGDDHGMFAQNDEPGGKYRNPRPQFHYMYYFQKYFGDFMINSSITGSSDIICYASSFSSGQSGIVVVNKGTKEQVVKVQLDNFLTGSRYYRWELTGGTDNGNFSRKVYINGQTTNLEGGGPDNYNNIIPYATDINGDIKFVVPPLAVIHLLVDCRTEPEYKSSKIETDPKTIDLKLSGPVIIPSSVSGVKIVINGTQTANIIKATKNPLDSSSILLSLEKDILNTDEIKISYEKGNLKTVEGFDVKAFIDKPVENALPAAPPIVIGVKTSNDGSQVFMTFNKNMSSLVTSTSGFRFFSQSDNKELIISKISITADNKKLITFSFSNILYNEITYHVSYSGTDVHSEDGGILKPFSLMSLENYAPGRPPVIKSTNLIEFVAKIEIEFDKLMSDASSQKDFFIIKVNGLVSKITSVTTAGSKLIFILEKPVIYSDKITLSYTAGNVNSQNGGILGNITDFVIPNNLPEPQIFAVPGIIKAELFYINSGMQAEATTDEGGGQNMGYIEKGDYLEYIIDVKEAGLYTVVSRIASASSIGQFAIQIPDQSIVDRGAVTCPVTGGWQSWVSVYSLVNLEAGKQHLKILALSPGFNINWLKFEQGNTIPPPNIVKISTNGDGDAIEISFDKSLSVPDNNNSDFKLTVGAKIFSIKEIALKENDRKSIIISFENLIYISDTDIKISYSGTSLVATDFSLVEKFENLAIENKSTSINTGIDSYLNENHAFVYPNPVNNKVFVKSGFDIDKIQLFDVTGRKILEKNLGHKSGEVFEMNVNLNNGIYFITLKNKLISKTICISK